MQTRCRRCGQYYDAKVLGSVYCYNCHAIEEEKYQMVRELVKANPGIGIGRVSQETGLSTRKIIKYVKEERLEFVGASAAYLNCEDCGAKIKTGRYCAKCRPKHPATQSNTFSYVAQPNSNNNNTSSKMFTAATKKNN